MKFNFRKISSVLGSAAMVGSTFALAAAASYPAPFVSGGSSDVAIVYGSSAAQTDYAAATNIGSDLSATLASQSVSVGGEVSTTGETAALFSGTKLYINDTLNSVKTSVTKSQLPTVLADSQFSGNVDAKITHTIHISGSPQIKMDKMPTSSDDPRIGLDIGTSATSDNVYNASATFSKSVNFTHSDSEGEEIELFGQKFTIGSETDTTKLVLLKSAVRVNLESDNPSQDVTVGDKKYTVTLVSASDTAATIRVTDEAGNSEQKEINEAASKKVQGVTIAVNTADETNLKLSASIIAGAEKMTLQNASTITMGEDDTSIDGTYVTISGTTGASTGIVLSVAAEDTDHDAIIPGASMTDPVFGTFKVDFPGMNIADGSEERESIELQNSGDEKMQITFSDKSGTEKTIQFAKNHSAYMDLQIDDSGRNITIQEKKVMYKNDYVMVGNEDKGHLLKLSTVRNDSSTTAGYNDQIKFTDIFSGTTYESQSTTTEGSGSIEIDGESYSFTYIGDSSNSDTIKVTLNYPDSTGNDIVLFPTIETSKGANLFFYQYQDINLTSTGLNGNELKFPDGDGYTDVTITANGTVGASGITVGSTNINLSAAAGAGGSVTQTIGKLTYNITSAGVANTTRVYLTKVSGGNIVQPAVVIFEEKDDDDVYHALIVNLEAGASSDDGIGIDDVERTWNSDASSWEFTLASDSDITREVDLWGTIVNTDASDSDQKSAKISYPNEQLYAQIYISAVDAVLSAGGSSSSIMSVKDSEVASVSTKNLLVIGGSCVNTVAAKLLGSDSALCSADFTTKTGIGTGEYIIQTFASPYSDGKIATLVAGYEAADTTNAVNSLKTNDPDTTVGKKFKGTTASSLSSA